MNNIEKLCFGIFIGFIIGLGISTLMVILIK